MANGFSRKIAVSFILTPISILRRYSMKRGRLIWTILVVTVIAPFSICLGVEYYVDQGHEDASDCNPGTATAPWMTIQHAADTLLAGDTVWIKSGNYFERVVPGGSGSHGSPILYSAVAGHTVVIDGTGVDLPSDWGGLIDLAQVSHITISGLTVQHAGVDDNHMGILIGSCDHITIKHCRTYDTVGSGIASWDSTDITIENNEIELACNDGEQECLTVAGTTRFQVLSNHVHHGGPGSMGGEGIDVKDGSTHGTVKGNHIHDLNRLGIYVDAWDKHTHSIEVAGNRVHHCLGSGFAVASEAGGLLENITIINNISYQNHYNGINFGHYGEPVAARPLNAIRVINNTFAYNGTSGWGGAIYVESQDATNVVIRNNICSGNPSFQVLLETAVPVGQFTIDHNLIHVFQGDVGETRGTDYIEADPLFVDLTNWDFHLTDQSPAIDSGSPTNSPVDDFDGNTRPSGSGIDMGAYEFNASASSLGVDLTLSQTLFKTGDLFDLQAQLKNSGAQTATAQPFVVLLDVLGNYFWHPAWRREFRYELVDIPPGVTTRQILHFIWPETSSPAAGIFIYGAIMSDDFTAVVGQYDCVEFGWE